MIKNMLLLLVLFFCQGIAAKNYSLTASDSEPNLELSFKLTDEGKRIGVYYLLIYCDTNAADTLFIDNAKMTYLYLNYNHHYTLRYVKPGYRDRVLIVRTDVTSMTHFKNAEFDYQIELVKENEAANTFADLPVAIIRYDISKKKFDYSRKYHRQVRQKNSSYS